MNSRIHAFVDAFEMTDSFELFLTPDHWKSLHDLMIEHSLPEPGKVERSSYKLIRLGEPRALQLPGSPTMYFMMDGSALVRRVRTGGPLPARGVWCGHIHTDDPGRVKVTRAGINPVAHCLFSQLKGPEFFVKKSGGARNARGSGHLMLLKITFTDRKAFQRLIEMARAHLKIRLFCKPALEWASAHLVIQSAMRTFIQRMNFFKSAKQHVLEARARRTLRVGLIKMNCFGITRHVAAVGRYHQTIRGTRAFFVTESFLAKVAKMPVLRQVPFGYSRERTVVLSDEANGALRCLIPTGNIVFALSDVDHLLRVGTLISPISPKAFPMSIPTKWLTRSKILRISMIQPDEADRRMVLFAWMTGNTSGLMTEKGVVEFCAAAAIKAAWLGYILRSTAMRSLARQVSRQTKRPALSVGPQKSTLESGMVVVVKPHQSIEADEMIHSIRRDYRPWITEFEKFKAMKAVETPRKETEPVVEEVSQSAKNLGMVSNHELSMAISLRRPVVGPVTHDLTDIDPRTTFLTGSPTQKIRPTAKPAPVREVLRGAQRTDNTERIRQQNAFTRLARLHQLGAEIEQGAVVDHTIEEKRAVASHARSQLAISRNERAQSRDVFIDEVRSRSRIERDELFDELEEQNYQSTKLRTRRIQKLKEDRRSQQQRLDRDKKFGIAFVNVSRQLGHANERMILRDRQSAQRAALAESTAGLRESVLQSRFNARERLFEIEHQRHRVAELDRIITNARHQERLGHRDERLRAVHEQKRRDALHDLPKMLRHALPPPVACPVRRDEQEEATAELGEWVGANLGAMEARALVDLLAGVLA
jgi:hypothetical protein